MPVVDLPYRDSSGTTGKKHAGGASEGYTRRVCEAFENWQFDDLPDNVVQTVKLFVLDTLGVIGGAAAAPGIETLNKRLTSWEIDGPSTGLVGKWRASPPTAALANGAAAHALDFDDMHDPARVHAYCVNLPAMLAVAEERAGTSGKDFLTALATGVEFHARMGLACYDSLGRGWHPTMVLGLPSATLGVGRLLGLSGEKLVNAFGIGCHQSSGTRQPMFDGDLSKRLGPGFAARSAVLAGYLALDGLTGSVHALEGEAGYFHMYEGDEAIPDLVFDGLGEQWEILNYSMKPYPCCRCTHNLIFLGIELRNSGIAVGDIESVDLFLGRTNWLIVGQQPYQAERDSVVHAQFNAAYCFARAVVDGKVDLKSFHRPQITDPEVAGLASRVRILEDATYPPTAMEPARIKVKLKDGGSITKDRDVMKGSPGDPMSEAEAVDKFCSCLDLGLGVDQAASRRFADMILNLEKVSNVSDLVAAFPDRSV